MERYRGRVQLNREMLDQMEESMGKDKVDDIIERDMMQSLAKELIVSGKIDIEHTGDHPFEKTYSTDMIAMNTPEWQGIIHIVQSMQFELNRDVSPEFKLSRIQLELDKLKSNLKG